MKANVAIVQAGGPTSVLNASLAGFLESASSPGRFNNIIGFRNGIEGLVKGQTMQLNGIESELVEALKFQPGAILGAGRYPLTQEGLHFISKVLRNEKISQLVLVGGNGTMWAAEQIANMCTNIQVVGIPKTVDNDLWGTDHAPGYLSASKFIGEAIRSLALDLWSMRNFERVRVVEVMGRNVGWLAAAAGLATKKLPGFPPILIYTPEKVFNINKFINKIMELVQLEPCLLVVVSEGVRDAYGVPIAEQRIGGNGSNIIPGGVGLFLANALREQGIPCRSENLGVLQRANTWTVSGRDREEAIFLGREAYDVLNQGKSGVMVGLKGPGLILDKRAVQSVSLSEVAKGERALEPNYLTESGIAESFLEWLNKALSDPPTNDEHALKVWDLAKQPALHTGTI